MKRNMIGKKMINLGLASAMVLSLASCGQARPGNEPAAGKSEETKAEAVTSEEGPLVKYDPPIEITYARKTSSDQTFVDGDNYDDNVWTRLIEEELGIKLTIAWSADGNSDAYRNKLNVSLASGDMPDMFSGEYKLVSMANDADVLADLTGAFEEYASPYVKDLRTRNELYFDVPTIDGKLVAIPFISDPVELQSVFLWIRDDWMANLNLSKPETFDDVIAIAKAFANDDPDQNGMADTYGLGLQQKLIVSSFGDIGGVAAAYGAPIIEAGMWMKDQQGDVVYGAVQPNMKDALQTLQNMYAEGLIDREFGVKDSGKLEDDINQGKVGMMFGANWNSFWPCSNILKTNPEAVFRPYPVPPADGHAVKMGVPWPITDYYMMNSQSKHPEAMIKMLNLYGDTNNDYSTQEAYAKYDDPDQWKLSPVAIADPHHFRHYQYIKDALEKNDGGANMPPGPKIRFGQVMDFIEKGDPAGYGLWGQIGPEGSVSIIQNQYIPNDELTITSLRGTEPESLVEKKATLDKIQLQAFTEIIMGGNIDLFDKFVEDWNNAGGAEITAAMNELYK